MKRRFRSAVVGLVLIGSATGCDSTTPLAPTPSPPPAQTNPAVPPTPNANAITIAGYVQDRAWRPLMSVRVEVLDGPDAGLSTVTDAKGEFRLVGEFDPSTRFRAASPQHRDTISVLPPRCDRCNPNWWLYFSLETEAASVDLAGSYSLTFVADPACTTLPEEYRKRTYPATVRPIDPERTGQFKLNIVGGSFLTGYDTFDVGVAGDSFAAFLGDGHGSPGVWERVTDTTVLGFGGSATASGIAEDATIVATLDGTIGYCELRADGTCLPGQSAANVLCTSTRHQLILERAAVALRSR